MQPIYINQYTNKEIDTGAPHASESEKQRGTEYTLKMFRITLAQNNETCLRITGIVDDITYLQLQPAWKECWTP